MEPSVSAGTHLRQVRAQALPARTLTLRQQAIARAAGHREWLRHDQTPATATFDGLKPCGKVY